LAVPGSGIRVLQCQNIRFEHQCPRHIDERSRNVMDAIDREAVARHQNCVACTALHIRRWGLSGLPPSWSPWIEATTSHYHLLNKPLTSKDMSEGILQMKAQAVACTEVSRTVRAGTSGSILFQSSKTILTTRTRSLWTFVFCTTQSRSRGTTPYGGGGDVHCTVMYFFRQKYASNDTFHAKRRSWSILLCTAPPRNHHL
jgi:hypothetical protein